MRYDRQAFADKDPSSDLRITFDTSIAYRMTDLEPRPDDQNFSEYLIRGGDSVMEVKVTGAVPYWLTRLIGAHGCILQSHSKYSNALEAGDPVLRKMLFGGPKKHGMTTTASPQCAAALVDIGATMEAENAVAAG
jgi:hypothetical protein